MENAPNIDRKRGERGRLVYDKARRTIVAENLPCPICNGVEGCDHTAPERSAAARASVHAVEFAERVVGLEQCRTCGRTDAEYSRKSRPWRCADPWHGDDHLRKAR